MLQKKHNRRIGKAICLCIKDGSIWNGNNAYSAVSGTVEGIMNRDGKDWHLLMRDGEEFYDVAFPYLSQYAVSLVCSLASCESLEYVKIKAYGTKECTKISVYVNDVRVHYEDGMVPMRDNDAKSKAMRYLASQIDMRINEHDSYEGFVTEYVGGRGARDYETRNYR